ncbi:MAG: hypothetical protein OXS32_13815 [Verrucomicrobiales bacterium]|nr:hypothetical protein [Verrucomicrobiales bacterium]
MNSKAPIYMFVASVVVAVGMLVFAVNRSSSQEGELTGQQAQEIAALQQSISELQQTVKNQSRIIEQLSDGGISIEAGNETESLDSSFAGGEDLWAVMEPFVEQHIEDREVRKREEAQQKIEDAMAKSRERRNEQLAEQLGLNPFQAEQLAKVRADFKQRRDDLFNAGGGIANPKELPEQLKAIKEEEQQALAGFLTADQLEQYSKRNASARVFSFTGDGQEGIAGAVGRALNFSINLPDGELGPPPEIQAITIDASAEGAPVFLNGGDGAAVIQSETRIISPAGGEAIIIRADEQPTPEE